MEGILWRLEDECKLYIYIKKDARLSNAEVPAQMLPKTQIVPDIVLLGMRCYRPIVSVRKHIVLQ